MNKFFIKILKIKLRWLAKLIIWKFNPDIIAITGSVGKTSAKEAIYAVLSAKSGPVSDGQNRKRVRKSSGNLNNELGMPLTILKDFSDEELKIVSRGYHVGKDKIKKMFFWLKAIFSALFKFLFSGKSSYPEILILEYGADRPGDIKYLLEIAKPKIAVISAIGETPVHIEFYPVRNEVSNGVYESSQAVAKEKSKLLENLFTSNFALLNFDDEMVMGIKEKTRAKIITFGFNEGADVKITNFENKPPTQICVGGKFENNETAGISFKIEYAGSFVPISLKNVFGKSHAYAAAIGAAIGIIYGMNLVEIAECFSNNYKPAKRRMNLILGIKNTRIIDDSYNASPLSMKQALETLRDLKTAGKIAVLGDMLELGEYSQEAHKEAGRLAAESVDFLITVGQNGKIIALAAEESGLAKEKILSFDKATEAIEAVKNNIKEKDFILIKASRGIGLDKVVDSLKV